MRVEQIAVFLENKSGRLAEITRILAENDINIRALSVADTADFGILRLIVDKVDLAKESLRPAALPSARPMWSPSRCRIVPAVWPVYSRWSTRPG